MVVVMRKTILQNATYLFIGNFGVRIFTALVSVIVARYLGIEQYGILSVGLAFGAIAGYFTDLGLTHTLIREGTKPGADANVAQLLGGAIKLRLIFATSTTFVSLILIYWLYKDPILRNTVFCISIPIIWGGALQGIGVAYFQMIEEMHYIAFIRVLSGMISAGFLLAGVFFNWSLYLLAMGYGLSSLVGGIVSTALVFRRVPGIRGFHLGLLNNLLAFTIGGLLVMFLPQMSMLVLQRVTTLKEVGYFSAAYRISILFYQIPGSIAAAFYPKLFQVGAVNHAMHARLSGRELKFTSIISGGLSIPFILCPDIVIKILFGVEWVEGAGRVLAILAWVIILQGINNPLADALTTKGLQNRRTGVIIMATFSGFLAYTYLGLKLGALGAAIAAVIVEGVLFLGYMISNSQGWYILKIGVSTSFIALLLTGLVVLLLKCIIANDWFGIVLAPFLYAILVATIDCEVKAEFRNAYTVLLEKYMSIRGRKDSS